MNYLIKKKIIDIKNRLQSLALLSPIDSLKVAAIITDKEGNEISCGYNYSPFFTSNPDIVYQTTLHAETVALLKCKDSKDKIIFISHGCCLKCATEIFMSGINEVYYMENYKCNKGVELLQSLGIKCQLI